MKPALVYARAERWMFFACALGIITFFVADDQPLLAALAVVLAAAGRSLASHPAPRRASPRPGAKNPSESTDPPPIPRWALQSLIWGAVAYAALAAIQRPEDFVSAIGILLSSLQVIRFFDRLRPQDHRQLLVMSLFSVVAAALTSNSLPVGVLLAAYTPVAAIAVTAHQVAIAHDRVRRRLPGTPDPGAGPRFVRDARRVVVAATAFGVLFAAMVFIIVPRNLGADMLGDWPSPGAGGATTMGFVEKVQLGRSGELGESQETVLDLLLTDEHSRNVGSSERAVLLRGLVFDEYNPETRAWVRSRAAEDSRNPRTAPPVFPVEISRRRGIERLTQRITIRNKQSDYLFALGRPVSIAFDRETNFSFGNADNVIAAPQRVGRVTYTVESQIDYSSAPDQAQRERLPPLFREGRIRDLTGQVLRDAGYQRDPSQRFTENDLLIARAIERYLRTQCSYSLEMIPPQPGEDPIEMFLFRTRAGHCEYFASAMTAMLRSVGIDARVVGGYRASEYNDIAGQYTVRQSDAHSWVEAQVARGLWITFDPSPPDGIAAFARRPAGLFGAARHLYDAAEQAWVAWVVGFDHQARSSLFGVPRGNVHQFARRFENLGQLSGMRLVRRIVAAGLVGVIVFAASSALIGGAGALWLALRRRTGRLPPDADPATAAFRRAREAQAAFYTRLLRSLERMGAPKPAWSPPLEHIERSRARLGPAADDAGALVRLYYALQFTPRLLSPAELAEAEARLGAIAAAADAAERDRPRTRDGSRSTIASA